MKKYLAAAFVFTATQFGQVQAQEAPPPAPIEAFYCNFHDGKSMKDLEPVATRLNSASPNRLRSRLRESTLTWLLFPT